MKRTSEGHPSCDRKEAHSTKKAGPDASFGELIAYNDSPDMERRLLRKLDLFMIPTMGLCYMLQYMDKLALSQATLLNLRKDLDLVGSQYTWCSAIFYFGYLAWSWPTSYLIVRLPLGKYLAVSVFIWGGVLMCHAACQNFGGLLTARFFLRMGEAAVAPGFGLITGMFYKERRATSAYRTLTELMARSFSQGAWFIGNCLANVFGGVIAYGIGHAASSLQSWRLLFLALGAITSGYAVFLFFVLPDSPAKASFLTTDERRIAVQRTLANKTGSVEATQFEWAQVWEAGRDPQTWCLVFYTFCVNLCNGGLTSFSGILIAGFGFSDFKSLLIQMPMGVSQIVFLVVTATIATFISSSRIASMVFNVLVSLTGTVMIYTLDDSQKVAKMVGLCFVAAFAVNIPLSLSIISSNVAGTTKRSMISVGVFAAYCVGNIVGPQFFLASEEPVYETGIRASLCGLALGVLFLGLLFTYYVWENERRNSQNGQVPEERDAEEILEESTKTDRKNPNFRYLL
ncbi:uncharacterized protein N7482_001888 [Penicillium canariense]|uniref:Major facilitator superfamily (MFS) profile domain-containing protein n=1 Tax=Penicillium canariense TaxID=189055 RepID=A0A9W9II07_9EURO|nr:uncharacterized protein N7482_001888 [Penicillium canariense]KAJ5176011.1 hypothetical protein N7482_001888 [Penicillium canariense]